MTKRNVAKTRARTKPRTEKPAIHVRATASRTSEKPVDSEIRRAAKRAGIAAPEPDAEVYRRLLRELRETTVSALGGTALHQTVADLEAVAELLELRGEGFKTANVAELSAVVRGVTDRLYLAIQLRDGLWDPDDPHGTVFADTKVLPVREGGAS
jgi:hypothetical protein